MKKAESTTLILVLALYVCLWGPFCEGGSNKPKLFGEKCTGLNPTWSFTKECDINRLLACVNGTCLCAFADNSVYDATQGRCVGRIGAKCSALINSMFCEANAECKPQRSSLDSNATVLRCTQVFANFDEPCNQGKSCEGNMECSNGKCACDPKLQFHNETAKSCDILVGGDCNEHWKSKCVANSVCKNEKCTCSEDFIENSSGFCKLGYGRFCQEWDACNSEAFMQCQSGRCQCQNVLYQKFDFVERKCVNLIGSECSQLSSEPKCIINAQCSEKSGKCECEENYTVSPYLDCMPTKKFGDSCENSECNLFRGMECNNGTCQCIDINMKYDSNTEACLGTLGSPCGHVILPFSDYIEIVCANEYVCSRDKFRGFRQCLPKISTPTDAID